MCVVAGYLSVTVSAGLGRGNVWCGDESLMASVFVWKDASLWKEMEVMPKGLSPESRGLVSGVHCPRNGG